MGFYAYFSQHGHLLYKQYKPLPAARSSGLAKSSPKVLSSLQGIWLPTTTRLGWPNSFFTSPLCGWKKRHSQVPRLEGGLEKTLTAGCPLLAPRDTSCPHHYTYRTFTRGWSPSPPIPGVGVSRRWRPGVCFLDSCYLSTPRSGSSSLTETASPPLPGDWGAPGASSGCASPLAISHRTPGVLDPGNLFSQTRMYS